MLSGEQLSQQTSSSIHSLSYVMIQLPPVDAGLFLQDLVSAKLGDRVFLHT